MRRYCSSKQDKPLAGASARGLGGFGQDLRSIWQPNSRLGRWSARACAEADFWETSGTPNRTPVGLHCYVCAKYRASIPSCCEDIARNKMGAKICPPEAGGWRGGPVAAGLISILSRCCLFLF